jgi:hypothetical protein
MRCSLHYLQCPKTKNNPDTFPKKDGWFGLHSFSRMLVSVEREQSCIWQCRILTSKPEQSSHASLPYDCVYELPLRQNCVALHADSFPQLHREAHSEKISLSRISPEPRHTVTQQRAADWQLPSVPKPGFLGHYKLRVNHQVTYLLCTLLSHTTSRTGLG